MRWTQEGRRVLRTAALYGRDRRVRGAAGVGWMAAAIGEFPLGRGAAIVERRLADQFDLHLALQARHGLHEHVVGVFVRGRRVSGAMRRRDNRRGEDAAEG